MSRHTLKWYEGAGAIPWENYPECRRLIDGKVFEEYKTPRGRVNHHLLSRSNAGLFRKHWGRADFIFRGEFVFYCWAREVHGVCIVVLSAKGKGTCYEIVPDGGIPQIQVALSVRNLFDEILGWEG